MLADAGATVTVATGLRTTVMAEVPVLVSQVAVMVAEPASRQVTSPLPFTVATVMLSLDQVTTRPVSAVPPPSLGVAVSCLVLPTSTVAEAGLTDTEATGTADTVMSALPILPSQVALMVAEPAVPAGTSPGVSPRGAGGVVVGPGPGPPLGGVAAARV